MRDQRQTEQGLRRLVQILNHDPRDHDLGELLDAIIAMPLESGNGLDFNMAATGRGGVTGLFGRQVREAAVDGIPRFHALARMIGSWIRRAREGHVPREHRSLTPVRSGSGFSRPSGAGMANCNPACNGWRTTA